MIDADCPTNSNPPDAVVSASGGFSVQLFIGGVVALCNVLDAVRFPCFYGQKA